MIHKGHKQQQRRREREWRVRKRKQHATYLESDRRTGCDHGEAEFPDSLAGKPDH